MVDRIREQEPSAKLVYNNSPSFNWTLNFRQQVFDAWEKEGKDVSGYDRAKLMSAEYDNTSWVSWLTSGAVTSSVMRPVKLVYSIT